MKKHFFSVATLCLILISCGSSDSGIEKQSGEVVSSIASDSKSDTELDRELEEIAKEERKREEELKANSTSLKFDKLKHDFGNVKPESDNTTVFTVTNTGNKPLIIENVAASCGCTTPKKPEKPIAPGKSDVIEVTFSPKPGQENEITKTVTVTANTVDKVHLLEIRAFVEK